MAPAIAKNKKKTRSLIGFLSRRASRASSKITVMKKTSKAARSRDKVKPGELRALTICCPELAVAILSRQKNVENRTWHLPLTVQDEAGHAWLALHVGASLRLPGVVRKHLLQAWKPEKALWPWNKMDLSAKHTGAPLPSSAIVGLIRVKRSEKLRRGGKKENPWALGPICWEIDRAVKLDPPIENVSGSLGLWSTSRESSLSPYFHSRLRSALRAAKSRRGLGCSKPRTC